MLSILYVKNLLAKGVKNVKSVLAKGVKNVKSVLAQRWLKVLKMLKVFLIK